MYITAGLLFHQSGEGPGRCRAKHQSPVGGAARAVAEKLPKAVSAAPIPIALRYHLVVPRIGSQIAHAPMPKIRRRNGPGLTPRACLQPCPSFGYPSARAQDAQWRAGLRRCRGIYFGSSHTRRPLRESPRHSARTGTATAATWQPATPPTAAPRRCGGQVDRQDHEQQTTSPCISAGARSAGGHP